MSLHSVGCLGDVSDHGGTVISTNQDGTVKVAGLDVAVSGALHQCPIKDHGTTPITATTTKSFINGKLIVTYGATAGCGAKIIPPDRKVNCE